VGKLLGEILGLVEGGEDLWKIKIQK